MCFFIRLLSVIQKSIIYFKFTIFLINFLITFFIPLNVCLRSLLRKPQTPLFFTQVDQPETFIQIFSKHFHVLTIIIKITGATYVF